MRRIEDCFGAYQPSIRRKGNFHALTRPKNISEALVGFSTCKNVSTRCPTSYSSMPSYIQTFRQCHGRGSDWRGGAKVVFSWRDGNQAAMFYMQRIKSHIRAIGKSTPHHDCKKTTSIEFETLRKRFINIK